MSSHLEDFVQNNREQFDDESPAPELWDKIRDGLPAAPGLKEGKRETPVRSLPGKRWLYAAAAVVLVSLGGWAYFGTISQKTKTDQTVASDGRKIRPVIKAEPKTVAAPDSPTRSTPDVAQTTTDGSKKVPDVKNPEPVSPEEAGYNEEMYHYTRLVELKHDELKTLQKDEPLLYKQFSGDVNKLDRVYQSLKTQLPHNSNREQLIEAMISNLQLQIGLLNKQLNIIKQIKHSKKAAYEKAYRSV